MEIKTDLTFIDDAINCLQKYNDNKALQQLEIYHSLEDLQEIKSIYQNYKFKVALIGEFSSGKSSTINAIIGDEILPIDFTPTTNLINEISFGNDSYVELKDQPATKTALSQESVADLSSKHDNKRLSTVVRNMGHSFDNFILFDTPGTNDPSSLSDEVIFDLVGEVDIVLFILNANQAFRKSEVELLTKIIRKKDIDKFFFVLNHADTLDEPYPVKKNFIESLAKLMEQNTAELKNKVFMLSAKNALAGKKANDNDLLNASGLISLEKSIINYVSRAKEDLLSEALKRDVVNQLAILYSSCEAFMDKLNGTYQKYQQQLDSIKHEISEFNGEIENEKIKLKENLLALEDGFKKDIGLAVKNVKQIIGNEIDTLPDNKLFNSRYIELRAKKLLEDLINEATKTHIESLEKLFTAFDEDILPKFKQHQLRIQPLHSSNKGKHMVNALATVGAVSAGATVLPYAGTALAGASTVGGIVSLVPMLPAIPYVGPVLATGATAAAVVLPVLGAFVVGALGVVVKVGLWGVKAAKNVAGGIEKKAQRMNYKREVFKSLDAVEREMLEGQDILQNFDESILQYITVKFPEKTILERKAETINEKYKDITIADQEKVQSVHQLMTDISLLCN